MFLVKDIESIAERSWSYTYRLRPPLEPKFRVICTVCFVNEVLERGLDSALRKIDEFEMVWKSASALERSYISEGASRYRIDMAFKCMKCSNVQWFGVPVSESYWRWFVSRGGKAEAVE